MTIVILYRNKWIFGKIRVIMMLLSEMRVTIALEYRKIVNKNEFSERVGFMGLIRAAVGAAGGTLADQWKEFFTVRLWIKK